MKEMMFSNEALRKMIVPLFLEQFFVMLVGLADTFVVSFAGEAAVSGVSLVEFLQYDLYLSVHGPGIPGERLSSASISEGNSLIGRGRASVSY